MGVVIWVLSSGVVIWDVDVWSVDIWSVVIWVSSGVLTKGYCHLSLSSEVVIWGVVIRVLSSGIWAVVILAVVI
jgi:hypothetical protein